MHTFGILEDLFLILKSFDYKIIGNVLLNSTQVVFLPFPASVPQREVGNVTYKVSNTLESVLLDAPNSHPCIYGNTYIVIFI